MISIDRSAAAPQRAGPGSEELLGDSTRGSSVARDMTCPRCNANLRVNYYEPECLRCGYVDYACSTVNQTRHSIIGSGTRYVLRYVGECAALANLLAHVQLQLVRNRLVFGVECPFCGTSMTHSLLSSRRAAAGEQRYKCGVGHRVALKSGKNGVIGWQ